MAKFTIGNSTYSPVPDGDYNAKFLGISDFEGEKDGKAFKSIRFSFKITDGDFEGYEISGLAGKVRPTIKNRLGRYLCLLANKDVELGIDIDPDDFIDHDYFVIIENEKLSSFSKL